MSQSDTQLSPEERILRLERKTRVYGVLLWALVAAILMGQLPQSQKRALKSTPSPTPQATSTPEVMSTHNFRLVDQEGRPRANLFVSGDEVYLVLGESSGKSRLALRVRDRGDASVVLADSEGAPKASIQCAADGQVTRFP